MIVLPKSAECRKCVNDIHIFQPSTETEKECFACEFYNPVPNAILRGENKCEHFEKQKGGVI